MGHGLGLHGARVSPMRELWLGPWGLRGRRDDRMTMNGSNARSLNAEPNVTPLIDVLLALLIIFMVIVPVTPRGMDALVPQPPKNPNQQQPNDRTIVVQVEAGANGIPSYKIN